MTDVPEKAAEAPDRIRVAQDWEGFWTCREARSGSPEYIRADLVPHLSPATSGRETDVAEAFLRLCEALGIQATSGAYLEAPRLLAALSQATQREPVAVSLGWVVGNGAKTRFRVWLDGGCSWTDDAHKATRFARREDAEAVHWDDEDVWTVMELHSPPSALANPTQVEAQTNAARDVLAERERQKSIEGWTPEHDDEYTHGELSDASACYAAPDAVYWGPSRDISALRWPWQVQWWKPGEPRQNLVKAGALVLAEIERLDRAALSLVRG